MRRQDFIDPSAKKGAANDPTIHGRAAVRRGARIRQTARLPRAPLRTMRKNIVGRLTELSLRDLFVVVLPLLGLLVGGFWLASRFIQPAPPNTIVVASGG